MMKIIVIASIMGFFSMIQAVEIRVPNEYEIPALSQMYYESWHYTFDALMPQLASNVTPKTCFEFWKSVYASSCDNPREIFLIALKEKEIVGVVRGGTKTRSKQFVEFDGEIDKLYVSAHCRNQGIGTQLIKEALQLLKNAGYHSIAVQSLAHNVPTNRFYEKVGGSLTRTIPFEYDTQMRVYLFDLIE